ncbi:MAG TPA: hypothetical protein VIY53_21100 [Acidobacteriaceae bacterium]
MSTTVLLKSQPAGIITRRRILYAVWIAGVVALFCLHFPHLLADFPNNSPWMDYSKYTDEGWYANAAVRHFVFGHWYLHGDFNPAVALPVWPLLLGLVFHFTGVSLAAARAAALGILGINLLLTWRIMRRFAPQWVALTAVSILVANPFLYAFSRLALLEPLTTCLLLCSWLLALRLRHRSGKRRVARLTAIGVLLCLMVLTKTPELFLAGSTWFLVAWACEFRTGATLRALGIVAAAAVVPWCAWSLLAVRPHYRVDFLYLFAANTWSQPTGLRGHMMAYWWALHGTLWIGRVLCLTACGVAAALVVAAGVRRRFDGADSGRALGFWSNPLSIASLMAAGGTIFFAGWANHPQPRYYAAVIYPLAFFLALGAGSLAARARSLALRAVGAAALAAIAGACIAGTIQIGGYLRYPEYTWWNAAQTIAHTIEQQPASQRVLLSISGDELSLMTGIPAICDDYGTWDLPFRIHAYQPGWFATWNEVDEGTLEDLNTQYSLEFAGEYWAFDDPDRNHLLLFRMLPLPLARQTYDEREEESENAGK